MSATDADSSAATLIFTVKSLPAKGQLKKDGTALAVDGTFTQQDITDGKVSYTHAGGNDVSDTFSFTVKDGAGNETAVNIFLMTVSAAFIVTVPGRANPFLAGMPAGATSAGGDSAPTQSPVEVVGLPVQGGAELTFESGMKQRSKHS